MSLSYPFPDNGTSSLLKNEAGRRRQSWRPKGRLLLEDVKGLCSSWHLRQHPPCHAPQHSLCHPPSHPPHSPHPLPCHSASKQPRSAHSPSKYSPPRLLPRKQLS